MRKKVAIIGAMMLALLAGRCALAQPATLSPGAQPGDDLHVYVITFGPGDDPWEKFGHIAIRIVDDGDTGSHHDISWGWGNFDFRNKFSFIGRFIQGRLFYEMGASRGQPEIDAYVKIGRGIRQQELNLTGQQKLTLQSRLIGEYLDPSQRVYRYDYYTNNCSTRVRDEIDLMIGHRLLLATKGVPSGTSYRFHTDRLDASAPWLFVALEGVLGEPTDVPIDRWQEMFLPEKVHDRLNDVRVSFNGYDTPLVAKDEIISDNGRPPLPQQPPRVLWLFLTVGIVLAAAFAGLGRSARRSRGARWGLVLLTIPWLLLMGVGGSVIVWAWTCTDHQFSRRNENILHISLLALPLVVLLPRLAFGRLRRAKLAVWIAITMAGLSLIGAMLKVFPAFYQANWNLIAMCLPANAALAYAAWKMARMQAAVNGDRTGPSTGANVAMPPSAAKPLPIQRGVTR